MKMYYDICRGTEMLQYLSVPPEMSQYIFIRPEMLQYISAPLILPVLLGQVLLSLLARRTCDLAPLGPRNIPPSLATHGPTTLGLRVVPSSPDGLLSRTHWGHLPSRAAASHSFLP